MQNKWMAENIKLRRITELKPYANNARIHPPEQIAALKASMLEFGITVPALHSENDDVIAGHGRLIAAQELFNEGHERFEFYPCMCAVGWTDAQVKAYVLLDNKLPEMAQWDENLFNFELGALDQMDFDLGSFGLTSFELPDYVSPQFEESKDTKKAGALADKFGAPPFSVLDTKQGYWQDRRNSWLAVTGNLTQTKEGVLGQDTIIATINEGSSNFDPVLAELIMKWFCPANGKILDPFGGEQTKGVVAGVLGFNYHAVEFRAEQVAVNVAACHNYKNVKYACGDSEKINTLISERDFDLCFTSPPYYDLEVYSKDDMSALGSYEEFMDKYEIIFQNCIDMLADDAFLVIKIGEIRDKKTGFYRNFVADNIDMFLRLGLVYYNEIILLNSMGTAPQRAARMFNSRKVVKVHQNVLVFCKGNPLKAAEKCGEIDLSVYKSEEDVAAL